MDTGHPHGPQTHAAQYTSLTVHVVFSTLDRQPQIDSASKSASIRTSVESSANLEAKNSSP